MKANKENHRSYMPMSEPFEEIEVHWEFSPEEFEKISTGRIPLEFGDRYFIFMEDNCLNICLWTGKCVYMLWFRQEEAGYLAYKLRIPKDPANFEIQNNRDDARTVVSILKDSLGISRSRVFSF